MIINMAMYEKAVYDLQPSAKVCSIIIAIFIARHIRFVVIDLLNLRIKFIQFLRARKYQR